ncbi:MAG TPA: ABC transporter substrate-binding protein [Stellaceae bacterium]|nr:ABC transporter substrate-binding protein [Stellaceae bacterium]
MRRRTVVSLIGAGLMWPELVAAQSVDRPHRIALLVGGENDRERQANRAAFEQGLQSLGWVSGRNIVITDRQYGADAGLAKVYSRELVSLAPDVILTTGTAGIRATLEQTRTIPIVFTRVSDPVGLGLVSNLAHPGGNATGFTNFEFTTGGKWLQTLKEVAPNITRVAMVGNPETSAFEFYFRSFTEAAQAMSIEPIAARVHDPNEMKRAIANVGENSQGGVIVLPDAFMLRYSAEIITHAAKSGVPAIYPFRFYAANGGLVSYGIDTNEQFRKAASYVDRILKGARPGDLPVQEPDKYELAINLKTANALGITVPQSFLLHTDDVIE